MDEDNDDLSGESKKCGNFSSRDHHEKIDATKIKLENDMDYFDVPSSFDNITAYIDRPSSSSTERVLKIDGMETPNYRSSSDKSRRTKGIVRYLHECNLTRKKTF